MALLFTDHDSTSDTIIPPSAFYQASRKFSSSGEFPAVCVTKEFVITVSAGYFRSGTLFHMVGKVNGKKDVEWHGEHKIELDGHCSFPSITATSEGVILLAYIKNKTMCYTMWLEN